MTAFLARYRAYLGLAAVLLLAWLAYHPGLSGGFLFDDFVNLDALGNSGPIDNWRTFWRFITSGTADPTGRPLALLTFLLDAHDWPASPAPFLRTNLVLHLFNGALLFAVLRRLGRVLDTPVVRNDAVALFAAALWLLHPLFVSTTLYVIQREAMLPATFVLMGLLAYDRGRARLIDTRGRRGFAWMLAGIGGGTLLAVASKGNGALLPLLAWVLEATVYTVRGRGDATTQRRLARIQFLLLVLPSLLLFAYVAHFLPQWNLPRATRPWTIGQRLLTEPRVLLDYLSLLVVPRSVSTGLYNDDYLVSTGLLHPLSTLPALLGMLGLLGSGFALRRRCPRYAAAILFFFAGHLLESTTVPLELYFEHRNYLPAMLLAWPLAGAVGDWKIARPPRVAVALALVALLACTTWQRAQLWGQPDAMARLWAQQNPDSSRAQATAAMADAHGGHPARALARLRPLWRQRPHDLQIAFNAIDAACATGGLRTADRQALSEALRHGDGSQPLVYHWLAGAVEVAHAGTCPGLALGDVQAWLDATLHNPRFNNPRVRAQNFEPVLGQLAMREGNAALALEHFDRALAAKPMPDVAARQASMLAAHGDYELALRHLDTYEQLKRRLRPPGADMSWLHARVLAWEGYWPHEMAVLRHKLHAAIAERDAAAARRTDPADGRSRAE